MLDCSKVRPYPPKPERGSLRATGIAIFYEEARDLQKRLHARPRILDRTGSISQLRAPDCAKRTLSARDSSAHGECTLPAVGVAGKIGARRIRSRVREAYLFIVGRSVRGIGAAKRNTRRE